MARHWGNSQRVISTSLLREGPLFKTGFCPSALLVGLWVTMFVSCLEVKGFLWFFGVFCMCIFCFSLSVDNQMQAQCFDRTGSDMEGFLLVTADG